MIVLVDRRRSDRRRRSIPVSVDRRRADRRAAPPASWAHGYVFVQPTPNPEESAALILG
jgi:hypothetical protein